MTDDLGDAGEESRSSRSKSAVPPIRPPLPMKLRSQHASPARGEVKVQSDDLDFALFESSTPNKASGVSRGQQSVAAIDLSSSQQHAFAPNTQMFSSLGEVVLNVDSSAANYGGG